MLYTRGWTKRPREALLQLVIDFILSMSSVGGSPKGANGTPLFGCVKSYLPV